MTDGFDFKDAAKTFRSRRAANISRYDQSRALLQEIKVFLHDGIKVFYHEAMNWDAPDLYVEIHQDNQLTIRYGLRADAKGRVLKGPFAHIFVAPDGKILHANANAESRDWLSHGASKSEFLALPLHESNWRSYLGKWLVAFIESAEISLVSDGCEEKPVDVPSRPGNPSPGHEA